MRTPGIVLTLVGSFVLAACEPGTPMYGGSRGDPIASQAPTSQSGGVSMAEAASENGQSTFPIDPGPPRDAHNASTPCVYHRKAHRYEECLHFSTDGRCSTYGASCTESARPRETAIAPIP